MFSKKRSDLEKGFSFPISLFFAASQKIFEWKANIAEMNVVTNFSRRRHDRMPIRKEEEKKRKKNVLAGKSEED